MKKRIMKIEGRRVGKKKIEKKKGEIKKWE